ncbi:ABC transporter ATP-binding protein [Rhizobium sp. BK251]|uniref:ABC transporter ATP-binding protein n=1 Tax=Rhizobium sp. BK251 TaxID=2512125 RepID=UPI0010448F2F|nr:ABC transporter ATP-binding protein [Rhizobium sp. BK251]TCL71934.1 ATP-binding cassette subfamily B multidrug efflux pump [Rhizobium sp. BK251]
MFCFLETLVDPFARSDDRTPPAGVWAFLAMHLRPFRHVMAMSLSLTALGAIMEVWLIGFSGRLVDTLASTTPQRLWSEHGTALLVAAAVILILRPLAGLLREGLDDIAFRPNAVTLIRWRAHRHVLRQSVGWFRNDMAGRIAARVSELGESATGVAYQVVHTLSFVTVYVIGSVWMLATFDLRLVAPLFVWIALYLGLMAYSVPRFRRASERFQDAYSGLTGLLVDSYANIDTLKLFAGPGEDDAEGREAFGNARSAFFAVQRLEVTVNASMLFLSSALMLGLVGYSIVLWQGGSAPLGIVAASLALSFRITAMAEWLLDAVSALFNHAGATRASLKTVAQPIDIPDAPDALPLRIGGGAIHLADVSHHYGRGRGGLDGVSLDIAAGEKVGLVGRSGAGKSTLVSLLLRFYEVERGSIEIDGQDIRCVTQESLRRHLAMVTQDVALLHRSVRDNIVHGMPDASQAAIDAAVRKAAADGFIPLLRDQAGRTGFDAHVGERGVKLSGGQRQRIALARAILKDAPILLLDEATSALDSEVEAAIQDTLYQVMEGKTVIAIAHRLSTIARMDRIVVLDEGRIAEQGRHEALLSLGGIYAGLWARQSGGFLGTDTPASGG